MQSAILKPQFLPHLVLPLVLIVSACPALLFRGIVLNSSSALSLLNIFRKKRPKHLKNAILSSDSRETIRSKCLPCAVKLPYIGHYPVRYSSVVVIRFLILVVSANRSHTPPKNGFSAHPGCLLTKSPFQRNNPFNKSVKPGTRTQVTV